MFGYITINKPELKVKEFDVYQSYYCGLCRELKRLGGVTGQLSLTYDLTFVSLLLSGLYEPKTKRGSTHCAIHPVTRKEIRKNSAVEYAAEMNLLLTYFKCQDDWQDEKNILSAGYAELLKRSVRKIEIKYPEKTKKIQGLLKQQMELETSGIRDLDRITGISGEMMAEILAWKQDEWELSLRSMGFYLGKFICLMDAYDDVEKDRRHGSYNLFLEISEQEQFPETVRQLLIMMMAECCREFEKLPIIKHGELLRNILYSGVWARYEKITSERRKGQEDK